MTRLVSLLLLLVAFLAAAAPAQEEGPRKAGPLVVFSDDFMFSVKEPDGWTGDIENAPQLESGVIFYREETFAARGTTIAIRIARKVDEDTARDLEHDMAQFRSLYPDTRFLPLKATRPGYRTFARLFAIERSSYHYLCYVNPGKESPYLFVVFMEKKKRKADEKELQAFRGVVRTLEWLPNAK